MLRKELSGLTPEELKFLVTRQLRCGGSGVPGWQGAVRWLASWPAGTLATLLLLLL